ncbi:unnamed protein product [Lactuca virosa]|uniref:Uncharacterized protein n=1 Tax=Lactuca virosa TaxID=75947 RepID=A0AAU9MGC6_9ASTR|nr:unnamed protein product [Lactuca virosa]
MRKLLPPLVQLAATPTSSPSVFFRRRHHCTAVFLRHSRHKPLTSASPKLASIIQEIKWSAIKWYNAKIS